MLRILFIPSHIGLGHVTRDYRIYKELTKIFEENLNVEWCSPPPPYIFTKAMKLRNVEECKRLFSMSAIAEEYIDKKLIYRPWILAKIPKYLYDNYEVMAEILKRGKYDLIVADEAWELVLKGDPEVLQKTIFLTDIVFKPYELNIFESIASYILNNFYLNRFPLFKERFFIGLPIDVPRQKISLLTGGYMIQWVVKYFKIAGRIPSVDRRYRALSTEKARDVIGVDGEPVITILSGGTSADSIKFFKLIEKFWKIFSSRYRESRLIIITGPKVSYKPRFHNDKVTLMGFVKDVGAYLRASDIVISRGGRTTVTDLEYLAIPSVIIPLNNHFEQRMIIKEACSLYPYIKSLNDYNWKSLYNIVRELFNLSPTPPSEKLYQGHRLIAKWISNILRN